MKFKPSRKTSLTVLFRAFRRAAIALLPAWFDKDEDLALSADSWDNMKEGVEKAVAELKGALDRIIARFK